MTRSFLSYLRLAFFSVVICGVAACTDEGSKQNAADAGPDGSNVRDGSMDSSPGQPMYPSLEGFTWFLNQGLGTRQVDGGGFGPPMQVQELDPPRAESAQAFRIEGGARGATMTTHLHHIYFDQMYDGVSFWVRRNSAEPVDGVLLLGDLAQDDLARATFVVTKDWQEVVIHFSDLLSDFTFTEDRMGSEIGIGFISDGDASVDVWVDDLALICTRKATARNCQ